MLVRMRGVLACSMLATSKKREGEEFLSKSRSCIYVACGFFVSMEAVSECDLPAYMAYAAVGDILNWSLTNRVLVLLLQALL